MDRLDNDIKKNQFLEEIANWTKLNVVLTHKKTILELLNTPKKQLIFQLSNEKSSRELANEFHMDKHTISKLWKIWIEKGIAKAVPVKGGGIRAQRSFSLLDFEIEIPSLEDALSRKKSEEE